MKASGTSAFTQCQVIKILKYKYMIVILLHYIEFGLGNFSWSGMKCYPMFYPAGRMEMKMAMFFSSLLTSVVVGGLYQGEALARELGEMTNGSALSAKEKVEIGKSFVIQPEVRKETTAGTIEEAKGGDRKELSQNDRLLILFLQILRAPK